MSEPAVNVRFETPTDPPNEWEEEAERWRNLNASLLSIDGQLVTGHPGFYPLTIKAAYVIGVIHQLCSTVSYLLQDPRHRHQFYIPAYGVFASAVDLLGRCLQGNATHYAGVGADSSDILAGFKWLCDPNYLTYQLVQRDAILIETSQSKYSIDMLISLRHFAAHGQGAIKTGVYDFRDVDYAILGDMPLKLAIGLENYWNALMPLAPVDVSEALCNRLAHASIAGFRHLPIFTSWGLFEGDGQGESITNIFNRFDWTIADR